MHKTSNAIFLRLKINYALDDWQTYHSIKGAFPCNTQNNVVYWNHLLAPISSIANGN